MRGRAPIKNERTHAGQNASFAIVRCDAYVLSLSALLRIVAHASARSRKIAPNYGALFVFASDHGASCAASRHTR
jgi:hypothetical protein